MDYTVGQANRENNRSFFKNEPIPIPERKRYPSQFFDPSLNSRSHIPVVSNSREFHALLAESILNESNQLKLSKQIKCYSTEE